MIDQKKSKTERLLFCFSILVGLCGVNASIRAQYSMDKTEIRVSNVSVKKSDGVLVSQRTFDSQTCCIPDSCRDLEAMLTFLRENISYPLSAIEEKKQGEVTISFTVTKEGIVANSNITKKLSLAIDREVLQAVKKMPVLKSGWKVDEDYKITLNFALPDSLSSVKPIVSIVEVETENLKMTLLEREEKEEVNSAIIAVCDSSMKEDTIFMRTVITTRSHGSFI